MGRRPKPDQIATVAADEDLAVEGARALVRSAVETRYTAHAGRIESHRQSTRSRSPRRGSPVRVSPSAEPAEWSMDSTTTRVDR